MQSKRQTEKKKILVIDDDHDIAEVLKTILEYESYIVRITYSGKETLHILSEFKPDIILLDYMLPDTNGKQLSQKLRQNKLFALTPIILVSAAKEAQNIHHELDINAYIEKPFDMHVLLEKVASLLKK